MNHLVGISLFNVLQSFIFNQHPEPTWEERVIGISSIVIIAVIAYFIFRDYYKFQRIAQTQTAKHTPPNKFTETHQTPPPREELETKELLQQTLSRMRCQWETDPENESDFIVRYQGETFLISTEQDSYWIIIIFWGWNTFNPDDIEYFARMRQAINEANLRFNIGSFYYINKEEKIGILHSKIEILFFQQIPYIDLYLKRFFDQFIQAKMFVLNEMQKEATLNTEEVEKT